MGETQGTLFKGSGPSQGTANKPASHFVSCTHKTSNQQRLVVLRKIPFNKPSLIMSKMWCFDIMLPKWRTEKYLYGVCVCLRLVNLVVRLREWAHKSLLENEERPDSFMERFRGPELKMAPSRSSNSQMDANGNGGIFRCVCPLQRTLGHRHIWNCYNNPCFWVTHDLSGKNQHHWASDATGSG